MADDDMMARARALINRADWGIWSHKVPNATEDIATALADVRRETVEECAVAVEATIPMGNINDVLDENPMPMRRAAKATLETAALNVRALNTAKETEDAE